MNWRSVTAIEAIRFCQGKTLDESRPSQDWGGQRTVLFADGTGLRITAEDGVVWSEHTMESATILIEVGE